MRVKFANLLVISIFLFLVFNLLNLELIKGKRFKELSNKNCIRLLPQEGSRGRILDRQGIPIVDNELRYDLMIIPGDTKHLDNSLKYVSGILGVGLEDLKDRFKVSFITPSLPITIARNIDIKQAIALEELRADIPEIVIQPRPRRVYPYLKLGCHIIGYLSEIDRWRLTKLADYGYKIKDIVGFGGVEEKYDYYLRQEEGGMSIEVDHRGRFMRILGFRPSEKGKDIQLTLDLKIQKIIEEAIGERKGCVIVMDPYNGQIFGMASRPNFNPSLFVKKSGSSIRDLLSNPGAPLLNRAISGIYPAGSVFKLVVAMAALQTDKINLSKVFFCSGSIRFKREVFSCWDTHHQENLLEAIAHSCNIFFYRTGLILGAPLIHDYAVKLGLARVTSIDLPYEENGFIPSPLWKKIYRLKNWFDGDTLNLSIGQGEVLVTPLQIARMMAVFANGGFLVTPYIVKAVDGQDITIYQKKNAVLPIKREIIANIRKGLRNAVIDSKGTANVLSGLSVMVAGKTGTAQTGPKQPHAWFSGFFPFEKPKFVICVFLEHGGAGYIASLLTKEIIERMIQEKLI